MLTPKHCSMVNKQFKYNKSEMILLSQWYWLLRDSNLNCWCMKQIGIKYLFELILKGGLIWILLCFCIINVRYNFWRLDWNKDTSLFHLLFTEIFCTEGHRNFCTKASLQKFLWKADETSYGLILSHLYISAGSFFVFGTQNR